MKGHLPTYCVNEMPGLAAWRSYSVGTTMALFLGAFRHHTLLSRGDRIHMRTILGSFGALLLLGLVAIACSSSDGSEVQGGDGKGASSSSGGNINLGGTTSTNTGGNGSGASGAVITPDAACATGTASAALSGVNMFVMFDRSTSMNDRGNDAGDSRWDVAARALNAFFADADAAGLKLALRFFPHDQPADGCNDDGCDVAACAMPLVELGTLTADPAPADAHEQALIAATGLATPGMVSAGTPISAALGGALSWAAVQRTLTPGENGVVVLVTDGEANGCDEDIDDISQLAADALAASGIRTYAIGLTGSQEGEINQIAEDGGTDQGIFVADGANAQDELLAALGAIRGEVLDCDFPMPQPKPGVDVDKDLINVNYTPGGGTQTTLTQVSSEDECTPNSWYYDVPAAPTRIVLCKSACEIITADAAASLQILLGCGTSPEIPK